MNIGVEGYYEISVVRNKGQANELKEDFGISGNLILDGFFTRWQARQLGSQPWYMMVGTGSTPPVPTNTQLQNKIGGTAPAYPASRANVKIGDEYFAPITAVAEWPIGSVVGNISEIGINLRGTPVENALDSRALIVDAVGNPTTITLTTNDQLIASYTLRFKVPTSKHISVVDFEGVPTTCTLETLGALDNNRWRAGTIHAGLPIGTVLQISSSQNVIDDVEFTGNLLSPITTSWSPTYAPSGGGVRCTAFFSINQGNGLGESGIQYIAVADQLSNAYVRQGLHFDPPLQKTDQKTLQLFFDYTLTRA